MHSPHPFKWQKVQKQDAATNIKGRRTSSEIVQYKETEMIGDFT